MFVKYRIVVIFLLVLNLVCAEEPKPDSPQSERSEYRKSFNKNCANSYSFTCLKWDIALWIDKLDENDNVDIFQGVSIVRENNSSRPSTPDIVADIARDFPKDPDSRMDAFLVQKVQDYITTHSIKVNLNGAEDEVSARGRGGGGGGYGGGGGGKKGGHGHHHILLLLGLMKSTLFAIALAFLAALAGKALIAAVISLVISGIIGLKNLSHGHRQTTYEVYSKPVHTYSASHSSAHEDYGHGHSGYGRSYDSPLPLGLQPEYKPE